MTPRAHVLGLFVEAGPAAEALREFRERGFASAEAFAPVPDERLVAAWAPRSPVRHFALFGGLSGMIGGLLLAGLTALIYNLIVWGKPPWATVPYLIIAFECTILLGGLGTLTGLLLAARLPRRREPALWDPALSEDRFGVAVECGPEAVELAAGILQRHGAEDVRRG
jgi:hypothetical protein